MSKRRRGANRASLERKMAEVSSHGLLVLTAVGLGSFASAMNDSIVNTVLPVLAVALNARISTIEWVPTIYLLVTSGLLLGMGRLGDLYGYRTTYALGLCVFIVASMLCTIATSAAMLIAFRGVQAVGGAAMFAASPAIITRYLPSDRRGQALGLQAMMTYLGLTGGPLLGGWLATAWTWRAVFLVNVPIGAVALWLSLAFIPRGKGNGAVHRFDLPGAVLFVASLSALLLALNQGHAWGWTSAPMIALLLAFAVFTVAFLGWEARSDDPMLDLGLFRRRMFTFSAISALLNYMSVFSITFLLPFYLITGRGLSPAQAGVILVAQSVVMAISAPLSGIASDRIGARAPATTGMAILAVGLYLLSRLGPSTPLWHAAAALALAGLGTGVFISPNNSALMGSAPPERQGIAAAVLATARNVGMSLGIGLAGALLSNALGGRIEVVTPEAMYSGVRAGLLAASALAVVGVFASATRAG